jgi:WD40 repeat protein
VWSAAFSPDSQWLVTASADDTLRVWSVDGWHDIAILYGHQGQGLNATFSPDGKEIISSGWDGAVRVRPCEVCSAPAQLAMLAQAHTTRGFTLAERETYLHE